MSEPESVLEPESVITTGGMLVHVSVIDTIHEPVSLAPELVSGTGD